MKSETWIFVIATTFCFLVTPAYWIITDSANDTGGGDWTGTSALTMTTLLLAMISLYLGFHASRMDPRPEDRKDGEIAEGAGELGFFPPYSWWPLWTACCLAIMVMGVVIGWWLFIIGVILGALALSGYVFEYYRGEHAH
jgi:hypothetical protein